MPTTIDDAMTTLHSIESRLAFNSLKDFWRDKVVGLLTQLEDREGTVDLRGWTDRWAYEAGALALVSADADTRREAEDARVVFGGDAPARVADAIVTVLELLGASPREGLLADARVNGAWWFRDRIREILAGMSDRWRFDTLVGDDWLAKEDIF
jgi:hypothetical protein